MSDDPLTGLALLHFLSADPTSTRNGRANYLQIVFGILSNFARLIYSCAQSYAMGKCQSTTASGGNYNRYTRQRQLTPGNVLTGNCISILKSTVSWWPLFMPA